MNVNCKDRDRILEDGGPVEWAALESHAATCAACAEAIRAWKALSAAAAELRDYSESPELWPRIQRSLSEQAGRIPQRKARWSWQHLWQGTMPSWQTALAGAVIVLLIASSAGWLYLHRDDRVTHPPQSSDLLKSQALDQVESAQAAYVKAIDKLATSAKPQLDNPDTPLLANYREKLMVLDSAIDDLRAQTGQNPSNAHLRYELLAMYQEKQRTLEEIPEVKR
jgi:hypothetical protein